MEKKQVIIESVGSLGDLLASVKKNTTIERKNVMIEQFFEKHPCELKEKIIKASKMAMNAYNIHEDRLNTQIKNVVIGKVTIDENSLCYADITIKCASRVKENGVFDEFMEYLSEFATELIE